METEHNFCIDEVRVGKKGQVTIPKKIRDEDGIKENDIYRAVHTFDRKIVLEKIEIKKPEDKLFEFLETLPRLDWKKAWKEVLEDRKREHR